MLRASAIANMASVIGSLTVPNLKKVDLNRSAIPGDSISAHVDCWSPSKKTLKSDAGLIVITEVE
ncbi:MAG: hypothetical protein QOC81_3362 [Thermoanaerobaculia bacterium]|nr:hypothetical protein [Thermoanaerobaculia bacterium]